MSSKFHYLRKRIPALLGILFLSFGCTTLVEKPADIPWHQCYQPITDPEAQNVLQTGIRFLKTEYGPPDIPVNEVMMRYSEKTEAAREYRISEHFSLTETVDAEKGIFCIYLSVPPGHEKFDYLLGHEIAHLKHPDRIDDPEMERFCNEFSRRLCEKENRPFDPRWENRKWVHQPKEHSE